jgi:23S rRNA G2069 N7-methylase RlmK/C1962 C5-methylase RlmI
METYPRTVRIYRIYSYDTNHMAEISEEVYRRLLENPQDTENINLADPTLMDCYIAYHGDRVAFQELTVELYRDNTHLSTRTEIRRRNWQLISTIEKVLLTRFGVRWQ